MSKYRNYLTTEQSEWLKDHSKDHTIKECQQAFNEKFNEQKSYTQIKDAIRRRDLSYIPENKYTKEQEKWLIENSRLFTRRELTEWFNQVFGTNKNDNAIKIKCLKLGVNAPTNGRYEQGNIPWTTGLSKEEHRSHFTEETYANTIKQLDGRRKYKVGDTIIRKVSCSGGTEHRPYVIIKEPQGEDFKKRTMPKGRYVWEQEHGKVPDGYSIVHIDGEPFNTDLSNLKCVSNKEKIAMVQNDWWRLPKELKETALTWCKLQAELSEMQE